MLIYDHYFDKSNLTAESFDWMSMMWMFVCWLCVLWTVCVEWGRHRRRVWGINEPHNEFMALPIRLCAHMTGFYFFSIFSIFFKFFFSCSTWNKCKLINFQPNQLTNRTFFRAFQMRTLLIFHRSHIRMSLSFLLKTKTKKIKHRLWMEKS